MAVVASSIFILPLETGFCPDERIADEPRRGKRNFDEGHLAECEVNDR
jgi:hypothetical protein